MALGSPKRETGLSRAVSRSIGSWPATVNRLLRDHFRWHRPGTERTGPPATRAGVAPRRRDDWFRPASW